MVSVFEWTIVGLILFGFVLPIWIFFFAAFLSRKMGSGKEPSSRYFAYVKILRFLHEEIQEGVIGFGPLWVTGVRELQKYPEYRDVSLLYLEEITITGSKKWDNVMENELKEVEDFLLGNTK